MTCFKSSRIAGIQFAPQLHQTHLCFAITLLYFGRPAGSLSGKIFTEMAAAGWHGQSPHA